VNDKMKRVVGIAFIKDGKLLIVQSKRSSKTNSWTFVGGGVEDGESDIEAAIREVSEEIHSGFFIEEKDLIPIMSFEDVAASDPNLMIKMTLFLAKKDIDVKLVPNEEILYYHWYRLGDDSYNVSSAITDHFAPYAVKNGLMYKKNGKI